jgi:hypothetical protein
MSQYFSGLLSHRELALIVRSALGPHTAIHNRFIRAIYTTAENQALVEENGPDWYKLTLPNKPKPAPQPQPAPSTGHRPNSTNSGEPPPSVVSPSHRARDRHAAALPPGLTKSMWLARVQGPRTPAKPVKTMWSGAFTSAPAPAPVLMSTFTSALAASFMQPAAALLSVLPPLIAWSAFVRAVKHPALGNGPPHIQTSLAGGITDLVRGPLSASE